MEDPIAEAAPTENMSVGKKSIAPVAVKGKKGGKDEVVAVEEESLEELLAKDPNYLKFIPGAIHFKKESNQTC